MRSTLAPCAALLAAAWGLVLAAVHRSRGRAARAHSAFLGTLHYAAPEQAKGRDAGPATDLYALGVTMFEHLTGRLPLEGKTTEAMLEAVLNASPRRLRASSPSVAPSTRSLGGLWERLRPRRLDAGGLPQSIDRCTGRR